jgi:hypothetical protein
MKIRKVLVLKKYENIIFSLFYDSVVKVKLVFKTFLNHDVIRLHGSKNKLTLNNYILQMRWGNRGDWLMRQMV